MLWQTVYLIPIVLVCTLPVVGWFTPLFTILMESYFLGFAMMDFGLATEKHNRNFAAAYLNSHKVDTSNYYGAPEDFDDVTADMATARLEYDLSDNTKIKNTSRWGKTEHQYLTTFSGNAYTTTNPGDLNDASAMRVSGSANNIDT